MKNAIYIILSLIIGMQSAQAQSVRNPASLEKSLLVTADDTKEEKLKKLLAIKGEVEKLRAAVVEKRKDIRNDKIVGAVGIVATIGAVLLFIKSVNGSMIEMALGTTVSLPLGGLGLGTTGYKGFRFFVDTKELEKLENDLSRVEAELQKQIEELSK